MRRVLDGLDKSKWLSARLKWFRTRLPAQRGLLVLGAIAISVLSLLTHVVFIVSGNLWVGLCGFTLLHVGVILGFVGVLLAEALGRGFRE